MKTIILLLVLAATVHPSFAQKESGNTYIDTDGKSHFFASTPLEDVEATSNSTVCALTVSTKKVSAKVPMTSFKFRKALMQEHFNENFVEPSKFPYAQLDAVISGPVDFTKDGTYDITLKGTFEVHGVKKSREIKGKLTIKNGQPASAYAEFEVRVADHGIKIPTALTMKIAEVVRVDVNFTFEKYSKS